MSAQVYSSSGWPVVAMKSSFQGMNWIETNTPEVGQGWLAFFLRFVKEFPRIGSANPNICTAVVVSLGTLPYIEWLDTCFQGVSLSLIFQSTFLVAIDTNGKIHGRWHGTPPRDNERSIALWTNALQAYGGKSSELIPPGPRSCEPVQFN